LENTAKMCLLFYHKTRRIEHWQLKIDIVTPRSRILFLLFSYFLRGFVVNIY